MVSALILHLVSAVVWVGGMFFAYMVLRPVALEILDAPLRLSLWAGVLARFFPWVWMAVAGLLLSGYGMLFTLFGGMAGAPVYLHIMQGMGLLMMLIFAHVFFAPFRGLKAAVAAQDWAAGGQHLARIRQLVGLNLSLGLLVVTVGAAGRFFSF